MAVAFSESIWVAQYFFVVPTGFGASAGDYTVTASTTGPNTPSVAVDAFTPAGSTVDAESINSNFAVPPATSISSGNIAATGSDLIYASLCTWTGGQTTATPAAGFTLGASNPSTIPIITEYQLNFGPGTINPSFTNAGDISYALAMVATAFNASGGSGGGGGGGSSDAGSRVISITTVPSLGYTGSPITYDAANQGGGGTTTAGGDWFSSNWYGANFYNNDWWGVNPGYIVNASTNLNITDTGLPTETISAVYSLNVVTGIGLTDDQAGEVTSTVTYVVWNDSVAINLGFQPTVIAAKTTASSSVTSLGLSAVLVASGRSQRLRRHQHQPVRRRNHRQ